MTDPTKQPGISIVQIILVQSHFQHRNIDALAAIGEDFIEVQINAFQKPGSDDVASVTVRVSTKPEGTGNYILDVEMLAVVQAQPGQENVAPAEYVTVAGASLLFPFLREYIATLTMRGRFGPIWLRPFNMQAAIVTDMASSKATAAASPKPSKKAKASSGSKKRL